MAKKNNCGDLFLSLNDSIYRNTVFQRFFEKNDPIVMGWAENVLAKLTADGVLPTFLQKKDNEDFKTYWGAITHLFALTVVYARKYKEIDSNKILFDTFIQNKGITTDLVDTQEQMEYLFYNYLEEYNKRGRLDIVSKEGSILGELLRLIRYANQDEFIFTLLQPQDTGWVMGYSSPSWKRTNTVHNITKAYEFTESVKSLDKYPLLRSSSVQIVKDRDPLNRPIEVMSFSGVQSVGIQGSSEQSDKYVLVNPSINYEISLRVKVSGLLDQNLKFGVQGFDKDLNQVNFSILEKGEYATESNWFHSDTFLNLSQSDIYYDLKGTILAHNRRYFTPPTLNFISGRAISMKPEMNFICPVFIQERSNSTDPVVYLYDFKIKPLDLPFEQGYLGARDIIASYYKNNAFQKEDTLNSFFKKYLLSYKNIFKGKIFETLKQVNLTFKVFSDRNQYLQGVLIKINGEIYKTNTNGEVTLKFYPGLYNYDVVAEGFDDIKQAVLEIDSKNKVEYIQMQGSAYQRTVSFSVRSNNIPIEGAKITFAGVTGYTGANGLAFFEAFPGIYEYRIEKRDFVTINRNVSIIEDTTIDIELIAIPYFNVSFRVRDNALPVDGAAVVISGDFDGDGVITEQTGSTNALGITTGFIMRAGTYQYRISRDEYITKSGDFSVVNNATIEIALTPVPKYNITFVVKNNALPVVGATVTFNGKQQLTDIAGKAVFKEPNGEYNYSVTKTEFFTQSGGLIVQDVDVTKNIDFIQIGYTVKFIVSAKGTLLSGAKVNIGTETLNTNSSGEVEFLRVSGNYNWSITLAGYYQETGSVLINGTAKTITVELILITYNAVFTVRINGQVLVDQPVGCNGLTYNTDAQGIAKFNLPPGSYGWSVSRPAYDPQSGTVLLIDRDVSLNVDLLATKGTVIFSTVDSISGVPLGNVAISINGETKYTAITGQVSFILVLGSYDYTAAVAKYNSNSGSFLVSEGSSNVSIKMVKEADKIWQLVYVAKEGNTLLSGVNISLNNGMTGITNGSGQATFSVISGSYDYTATYNNFFPTVTGISTVSEANTQTALSFIRKTTQVSFSIKDSLNNQPVNGVSVELNNTTRTTNTLGETVFTGIPMSSNSLKYLASKNPPYKDLTGAVTVDVLNKVLNLVMGQYTYSVVFTVKSNSGVAISGASVICNGKSGTTNSTGQVTLSGYINGTYSYTVTATGWRTVASSIVVTNGTAYANAVMYPVASIVTFHLQYNSTSPAEGVPVKIGSNTISTNSSGNAAIAFSDGNYSYEAGAAVGFMSVTGSFSVASAPQTITVTIEDTFALSISLSSPVEISLPILNRASSGLAQVKVDWGDGVVTVGQSSHYYPSTSAKIIKIGLGSVSGTLQWGVLAKIEAGDGLTPIFAKILTGVAKWFRSIHTLNFQRGAFFGCMNLSSFANVNFITLPQITGTPAYCFHSCSSLRNIPSNFFQWKSSDGNFSSFCQNTGLTGVVNIDSPAQVTSFAYAFAQSASIVEINMPLPISSVYSAEASFCDCSSLTYCHVIDNATQITTLLYTFKNCSSLITWPAISDITRVISMASCFYGCTRLGAVPRNNYLPRRANAFNYAFYNCKLMGSPPPGFFGPETITSNGMVSCFEGCSHITNLEYARITVAQASQVSNFDRTYAGTGVVSPPDSLFQNFPNVRSFNYTFAGCKDLRAWRLYTPGAIFKGCKPVSVQGIFQGCGNLDVDPQNLWNPPEDGEDGPCVYIGNYSYAFDGCVKILLGYQEPPRIRLSNGGYYYMWDWSNRLIKVNGVDRVIPILIGTGCFGGISSPKLNGCPSSWR